MVLRINLFLNRIQIHVGTMLKKLINCACKMLALTFHNIFLLMLRLLRLLLVSFSFACY